jgi:hypothetical protein
MRIPKKNQNRFLCYFEHADFSAKQKVSGFNKPQIKPIISRSSEISRIIQNGNGIHVRNNVISFNFGFQNDTRLFFHKIGRIRIYSFFLRFLIFARAVSKCFRKINIRRAVIVNVSADCVIDNHSVFLIRNSKTAFDINCKFNIL